MKKIFIFAVFCITIILLLDLRIKSISSDIDSIKFNPSIKRPKNIKSNTPALMRISGESVYGVKEVPQQAMRFSDINYNFLGEFELEALVQMSLFNREKNFFT